jgi:hypothetical protein
MKTLVSKICYRVPGWSYCNLEGGLNPFKVNKEHCRFCVKTTTGYVCVLHNITLAVQDGQILKTSACSKASQFAPNNILEDEQSTSKPFQIVKTSMKMFISEYKRLRAQGLTEELALQLAQQSLIESR